MLIPFVFHCMHSKETVCSRLIERWNGHYIWRTTHVSPLEEVRYNLVVSNKLKF